MTPCITAEHVIPPYYMTITPPLVAAHLAITTTDTPIGEIAAAAGLSVAALEMRLERAYGARSRQLRPSGAPTREPRAVWQVRLTAEERARVEELLEAGRAAGATTDGEALIKGLDLLGRAALFEAVNDYRAAAASTLRTYSSKERFNVGEALHHPTRGHGVVKSTEAALMTVDFAGDLQRLRCAKPRREPKTPVRRLDLPSRLRHDPTRPSAVPLEPQSAPSPPLCSVVVRGFEVHFVITDPTEGRKQKAGQPHRNGESHLVFKFDHQQDRKETATRLTAIGVPPQGWPKNAEGKTPLPVLAAHIMEATKGKRFPLIEAAATPVAPPPPPVVAPKPEAPRPAPAAVVKHAPPKPVTAPADVLPSLPAWAWAEARGCAGIGTDADFDLINSRGGYTGPGVGPEFGMVQEASRRLAEERARAAAQEPPPPPPEEAKIPARWALAEARVVAECALPGDWAIINAHGSATLVGLRASLGDRAEWAEFQRAVTWLAATPIPTATPSPSRFIAGKLPLKKPQEEQGLPLRKRT